MNRRRKLLVASLSAIALPRALHAQPRPIRIGILRTTLRRKGEIALFASRALLEEFREVIQRRKFAAQLQRTGRTAVEIYRDYRSLAERVPARRLTRRVVRDADDDQVTFRGIEIIAPAALSDRLRTQ